MKSFFDMVHSHPKKLALFGAACNAVTDPIAKASQFFELIQVRPSPLVLLSFNSSIFEKILKICQVKIYSRAITYRSRCSQNITPHAIVFFFQKQRLDPQSVTVLPKEENGDYCF